MTLASFDGPPVETWCHGERDKPETDRDVPEHRMYGMEGVNFYTRLKVITSRWPDPAHRGVDLGFPQMT